LEYFRYKAWDIEDMMSWWEDHIPGIEQNIEAINSTLQNQSASFQVLT
jgi:hypothetical protein